MEIPFSKYEGTGNDFIIIDNRRNVFKPQASVIKKLCDRRFGIGADGLMLLCRSGKHDFEMIYFNADGREGSMCGNGGRCITLFAKRIGLVKSDAVFSASDGLHRAEIISYSKKNLSGIVNLQMGDVNRIVVGKGFCVLNTGSPHYVKFADGSEPVDIVAEGRRIRNSARFRKKGINVNFVSVKDGKLIIRTYERGVEEETLSCGTGAVAAALAAVYRKHLPLKSPVELITRGGNLRIHFSYSGKKFSRLFLEGAARFVFDGSVAI